MEEELIENFYKSINPTGSSLLKNSLNRVKSSIYSKWNDLLTEQRLPREGWNDTAIEGFLSELAGMDSNNFEGIVGMGEREGRISNVLIKKRNFGYFLQFK